MRANWKIVARRLREKFGRDRASYFNRNKPDDLLLLRDFVQRLGNRRFASFRVSATRLVRAAMHFAPVLARRIRENAGSRRQLQRPHQHRQHDCKQDRRRPPHENVLAHHQTRVERSSGGGPATLLPTGTVLLYVLPSECASPSYRDCSPHNLLRVRRAHLQRRHACARVSRQRP